jgi:hypothetical protein
MHLPSAERRGRFLTVSEGSNPIIRSAFFIGMTGLLFSLPILKWLVTDPPLWDIPIVSAVLVKYPAEIDADANIFDARTVP